jgi:DMSO/TMAO reductase YedYZ heme-binding membrane subunit
MLAGPRLLALISLALVAMAAAIAAGISPAELAARTLIVWTARTSLVLFALAYAARPLVQLRPSPAAKALLARRKWLGLGFAVSHGLHLAAILWLASPDFGAFVRAQAPTTAVAALTFVLIGAMTVTSIESVKRAMPARAWRRLHWTGMQLAFLAFTSTYAGAIGRHPLYAVPAALCLAIGALRAAAWLRARRHRARRAADAAARRAA